MMTRQPYPGLRPFQRDESDIFFGRETQIDELLERLEEARFLAVVGPSGCGKSSLIKAGMIPALETGFVASAGARWRIAQMRPGNHPIASLAEALLEDSALGPERKRMSDSHVRLRSRLWRGPSMLTEIFAETPLPANSNLLLLVDQFEEIFRYRDVDNKEEGNAFINLLLRSVEIDLPLYVVITMRSDFLGDCTIFEGLPEAINESQFLTPRLTRDELRAAIVTPALVSGRDVDDTLVNTLLNDAGLEQDQLPVLQHVLMRTWEHEVNIDSSGHLDMGDYAAVGKMSDALANHAEEAMKGMTKEDKVATKKMFQALTAVDVSNRLIRRPETIARLAQICETDVQRINAIIDRFQKDNRNFLVEGKTEFSNDIWIDISHESLIRQWPRLREWVEEENESAKKYHFLAESAAKYYALHEKGEKGDLLGARNVRDYLQWHKKFQPNANWARRYEKEDYGLTIAYLHSSAEKIKKIRQRREWLRIAGLLAFLAAMVFINRYFQQKAKDAEERASLVQRSIAIQDSLIQEQDLLVENLIQTNNRLTRIQADLRESQDSLETTLGIARAATNEANRQRDTARAAVRRANAAQAGIVAANFELSAKRDSLQQVLAELVRSQREADSLRLHTLITNFALQAELEEDLNERASLALRAYYLNEVHNQGKWEPRITGALWNALGNAGAHTVASVTQGISDLAGDGDKMLFLTTNGEIYWQEGDKTPVQIKESFDYRKNSLHYDTESGNYTLQDKGGNKYMLEDRRLVSTGQRINGLAIPYTVDSASHINVMHLRLSDTLIVGRRGIRSQFRQRNIIDFRQGQSAVSYALSPSARYLAVGTQNGWLYVVDLRTAEILLRTQYHEPGSRITSIAFSPDDTFICTVGLDGKVRLNRVHQMAVVRPAEIVKNVWVNCVLFVPGDILLIGTEAGQILRLNYSPGSLAPQVCASMTAQVRIDPIDRNAVDALISKKCDKLIIE